MIYCTAFLIGVVSTNILESKELLTAAMFSRHQLLQLAYVEVNYESYFIRLLGLRLKNVSILWLLGKVLPVRWIRGVCGVTSCIILGSIMTLAILANGVWGLLLFIAMIFPQWLLFIGAFFFWGSEWEPHIMESDGKKKLIRVFLILLFVISGCVTEAYVNPFVLRMVLKY